MLVIGIICANRSSGLYRLRYVTLKCLAAHAARTRAIGGIPSTSSRTVARHPNTLVVSRKKIANCVHCALFCNAGNSHATTDAGP